MYQPVDRPTFYFIGVTTGSSSIMTVFPRWAEHLGIDAEIKGIDLPIHAPAQVYRDAVEFIKNDPLSLGALVTTHKLDLFAAAKDMFDYIDPLARLMAEVSSISKRDGQLRAHAKDPITSGLAIDNFLAPNYFANNDAALFSMGAGGSTIAMTWHLAQASRGKNRPSRMIVSNRSAPRLDHLRQIHHEMALDIPVDYVLADTAKVNDATLSSCPEGSLIVNATGLGKDVPGSPLSWEAQFPKNAMVWELNYRGDLVFLDQANAQQKERSLQIEDGWTYFIHGWTQVIAEVFDIEIPSHGLGFDRISEIARDARKVNT